MVFKFVYNFFLGSIIRFQIVHQGFLKIFKMFYFYKKYGDGFYSKFLFFELDTSSPFWCLTSAGGSKPNSSCGPFYQNIQEGSQLIKSLHYRVINGLGFKSATFSSHEKQKGFDKTVCSSNDLRGQIVLKKTNGIFIALIFTLININH